MSELEKAQEMVRQVEATFKPGVARKAKRTDEPRSFDSDAEAEEAENSEA